MASLNYSVLVRRDLIKLSLGSAILFSQIGCAGTQFDPVNDLTQVLSTKATDFAQIHDYD